MHFPRSPPNAPLSFPAASSGAASGSPECALQWSKLRRESTSVDVSKEAFLGWRELQRRDLTTQMSPGISDRDNFIV